jgi:hypothetical protein
MIKTQKERDLRDNTDKEGSVSCRLIDTCKTEMMLRENQEDKTGKIVVLVHYTFNILKKTNKCFG